MKKYTQIHVGLKCGVTAIWDSTKDEWDDYSYDGTAFIIKKNGEWVGIYNMDMVANIIVK